MTTQTYTSTLTVTSCGVCEVTFGMETSMYNRVRRTGDWFWCPNGHKIHYYETDMQRLRKQIEAQEAQLEAARSLAQRERQRRETAEHQRRAYKGQVTKIKRRVGRGVCPCCNRTFADLARHMAGQHPDFIEAS